MIILENKKPGQSLRNQEFDSNNSILFLGQGESWVVKMSCVENDNIQITNSPNLAKLESFLKNSLYTEVIEFSANFNKTLSVERRLRLPFLDPQTNVAQNHSNLFMSERQRMPGFRQGQIYSYPSNRWRKSRRQYLDKFYR